MYDSSNPSQRAEVKVMVTVQRNVNGPVFSDGNYDARISENYPIGERVVTVSASDSDGDEIRYALLGPAEALNFFYINPLSGEISVTGLLTDSTERQYRVNMAKPYRNFVVQ